MLKNLYKHEFKALLMWFIPLCVGVFVISVLCKLTYASASLIDADTSSNIINNAAIIICSGSCALCFLALSALLYLTLGIVVIRFYKNIFSGEGYFTMCIPVTAGQHQVCKMVCGCLCMLVSVIVGAISLEIFSIDLLDGHSFFQLFFALFHNPDAFKVLFFIELLIMLPVLIIYNVSYLYAAVVFGQKFKNKIGGTIISYLLIHLIISVLISVLTFIVSIIFTVLSQHIQNSRIIMLVLMAGCILVYSGIATAFISITQAHLKNRFNLE